MLYFSTSSRFQKRDYAITYAFRSEIALPTTVVDLECCLSQLCGKKQFLPLDASMDSMVLDSSALDSADRLERADFSLAICPP